MRKMTKKHKQNLLKQKKEKEYEKNKDNMTRKKTENANCSHRFHILGDDWRAQTLLIDLQKCT